MRALSICAGFTLSAMLASCFATGAATRRVVPTGLTVILDFRGAHSDLSVAEMKHESASILSAAGVKLDWRQRGDAAASAYPDLVVMTFKGACKIDPAVAPAYEAGPLASTATTNHVIQSFGQVDCDHVAASARSAMFGGDFAHADQLMGRAMGRVVVHEIVHMITQSAQHSHEGVFQEALSGRQLIAPELPLSALDVDHLFEGEYAEAQQR